jgi:hypothetical protein
VAANMSAENIGMKYGINRENCLQMGTSYIDGKGAFESIVNCSLRYSSSSNINNRSFTKLERSKSCNEAEALKFRGMNNIRSVSVPDINKEYKVNLDRNNNLQLHRTTNTDNFINKVKL